MIIEDDRTLIGQDAQALQIVMGGARSAMKDQQGRSLTFFTQAKVPYPATWYLDTALLAGETTIIFHFISQCPSGMTIKVFEPYHML